MIYKEDFLQEQSENKRLLLEIEEMRNKLKEAANVNNTLMRRKELYKKNYAEVNSEKSNIIAELKRLSTSTPPSTSTSSFNF